MIRYTTQALKCIQELMSSQLSLTHDTKIESNTVVKLKTKKSQESMRSVLLIISCLGR